MKRVAIVTLGCKVNQYESAAFTSGFANAGCQMSARQGNADLVVINTCAVTGSAGAQSRQAIRQAARKNPKAALVVTGCYAEVVAHAIKDDPVLQHRTVAIFGNSTKDRLVEKCLSWENTEDMLGKIAEAHSICRLPVRRFGERCRAYLRIQDGCENFCTYCIVPFTRGPSRSLPYAEVLEQAKIFANEGYLEIVLTGINLGNYGKDFLPQFAFTDLLERLTMATPEIAYRISSLEPTEINDKLLDLMQERKNIQPHLHIPLQSGNNEILLKMNRNYSIEQFRDILCRCRETLPNMAIGIDILAGFPGETEQHFAAACTFLATVPFSYLHVFPYSSRPGTKAATYSGHLTGKIKSERVACLRRLSDQRRQDFFTSQLGTTQTVIVENQVKEDKGQLQGLTGNYVPIVFPGPANLIHRAIEVRLLRLHENYVMAEVAQDEN